MNSSSEATVAARSVVASWALSSWPSGQQLGMTVRDRVAQELRHRILLGTLRAGDRVDLDALADEFGTSRTPIREACLALANDGLVRLAPRSGITVLGITDADLLDNFELMSTLAGMAAGYAAERATTEDLAQIVADRDALAMASASGGDAAAANFTFHRHINQASHSPRVMTMIAQAARLFPERLSDVVPEQIACSLGEHAEVVEALLARNPGKARTLMEHHFRQAEERLRTHLESGGRSSVIEKQIAQS